MSERDGMVRRISAALDHIDKHGNLEGFSSTAEENQALINAATAQGLIAWNAERGRYDLSKVAHKWLKVYYQGRGPGPSR
jgi:predicted DsbA family dithiol-disulfide isomerase